MKGIGDTEDPDRVPSHWPNFRDGVPVKEPDAVLPPIAFKTKREHRPKVRASFQRIAMVEDLIVDEIRNGMHVDASGSIARVSASTLEVYRKEHPDFEERVQEARSGRLDAQFEPLEPEVLRLTSEGKSLCQIECALGVTRRDLYEYRLRHPEFEDRLIALRDKDARDRIEPNEKAILRLCEDGHGFESACASFGIGRQASQTYRRNNPDFDERVRDATEARVDAVETRMMKVAAGTVVEESKAAIQAGIFVLRGHRSKQYVPAMRHEIGGADGGPVVFKFVLPGGRDLPAGATGVPRAGADKLL